MEKLYKQFVESVTKWKNNHRKDDFFVARLRLTFYYSITAIVIFGHQQLQAQMHGIGWYQVRQQM